MCVCVYIYYNNMYYSYLYTTSFNSNPLPVTPHRMPPVKPPHRVPPRSR